MITTRDVEVIVRIVLQINTEELECDIDGEGARKTDEEIWEDAISYAVQEIDYNMSITEPGILVLRTELQSYNV